MPLSNPPLPIVYVDVDDTLVRSFGSKRIPISSVVDRVRELHRAGFTLYCWSSGGAQYCRDSAVELGIAECFVDFLPKPHFMIDDQHPSDWRALRWLHTNEAASMTPDQYLKAGDDLEGKGPYAAMGGTSKP